MQAVGERLGLRIVGLIKLHGVPSMRSPILPVLHDDIDRETFLAEPVGRLQNLVGGVETLTAVDVTQGPLGYQRRLTGELAIRCDNLIGCAHKHRVVHSIGHRRTEHGLAAHSAII